MAVQTVCATVTNIDHCICAKVTIPFHMLARNVPKPVTTEIIALTIEFQI